MLSHWTDGYVTVDGLEYYYVRTGEGEKPPILLLHGFSDNGLCWLPVARDLAADYDVILPDARGHGRSARVHPDEPLNNAADVAGLIAGLGLHKPFVGGHSMGGLTATELGAHYADLVGGLILEDPAWIDPSPVDIPFEENPYFAWLLNVEHLPLEDIAARGKADNPIWPDVEFPAWAESKRQLDKHIFGLVTVRKPWRAFVANLTVPTLLIAAEPARGAIVSPAAAQEAAALSSSVEIAHIPGAGHNIRRENYPAFMAALQAFLSRHSQQD